MSRIQVTLSDPEHGWIVLTVRHGEHVVVIDVSDVYPSLTMLTQALLSLLTLESEQIVTWTCEPTEYDMVFSRNEDTISLDILTFSDSERSVFMQNTVLSVSGGYSDICLPFWRSLRGLQGRFTRDELSERWTEEFPEQALSALTDALGTEQERKSAL